MIGLKYRANYAFARQFVDHRRVLDIGCGAGSRYGVQILSGPSSGLVGVDISADAIQSARDRFAGSAIGLAVANANALPFCDSSFDIVVAFETIEYIEDVEGLLQEIVRVLRPSGQALISVPNRCQFAGSGTYQKSPVQRREYGADDFGKLLQSHFLNVKLVSQSYAEAYTFEVDPEDLTTSIEGSIAIVDANPGSIRDCEFLVGVVSKLAEESSAIRGLVLVSGAENGLAEREYRLELLKSEIQELATAHLESMIQADHQLADRQARIDALHRQFQETARLIANQDLVIEDLQSQRQRAQAVLNDQAEELLRKQQMIEDLAARHANDSDLLGQLEQAKSDLLGQLEQARSDLLGQLEYAKVVLDDQSNQLTEKQGHIEELIAQLDQARGELSEHESRIALPVVTRPGLSAIKRRLVSSKLVRLLSRARRRLDGTRGAMPKAGSGETRDTADGNLERT